MTIPRSSALSMNVLLIFDMYDLNGILFLKTNFMFLLIPLSVPETVIFPFKTIYLS